MHRTHVVAAAAVTLIAGLAACGGSSSPASSPSPHASLYTVWYSDPASQMVVEYTQPTSDIGTNLVFQDGTTAQPYSSSPGTGSYPAVCVVSFDHDTTIWHVYDVSGSSTPSSASQAECSQLESTPGASY